MRIDGKALAQTIQGEVAAEVAALKAEHGLEVGLATVLVGENPASQTYVQAKRKTCQVAGIRSLAYELPATVSQTELETLIQELNQNPAVHGILVQLPLPKHLDEQKILDLIRLEKDVDGFHPMNMGLLAMKGRHPYAIPCTPYGVMVMLERAGVEIAGKTAVVLGRSNIVGIPMAHLLLKADASVTIAHSRTPDLPTVCRGADILIAAVGRAHMVKADWVKPGAAVIDVGINQIPDPSKKSGFRLVGDVATEEAETIAGLISPVPGGVGPMTIAMLMKNVLGLAKAGLA